MKKISDSRKLLGATSAHTLKELNTLYKGLMKTHHPDRHQDEALKQQAEAMSQHVIEAYKFLESIHPETHAANAEEFEKTIASNIGNWHYQHMTLHITFGDGTVRDVAPDSFGEHVVDLPSGPVRVIAQFAATRVATPWFTI